MGISSDGLLFYGFEIDYETVESYLDDPDESDVEWPEVICAKLGMIDLKYGEAKKYCKETLGIECHGHCSWEYYSPVFCITGTFKRAWRGSPLDIDPADLAVQPDWDAKLEKVAKLLGFDKGPICWMCDGNGEPCTKCGGTGRLDEEKPNTTPRWILASMYG